MPREMHGLVLKKNNTHLTPTHFDLFEYLSVARALSAHVPHMVFHALMGKAREGWQGALLEQAMLVYCMHPFIDF